MIHELRLCELKAGGWIERFLKTQASGLTGNMGRIGKPFVTKYWEGEKDIVVGEDENFLGGLNCTDDAWTPFEQNAYWIDGMIRCGWLIDDKKLIEYAEGKIYPAIENADADGYIGPSFLKDGMLWAHSVYFRALIAEYEATGDGRILEALKKHYIRTDLKERIKSPSGARIIAVRDISAIECALWLYGKTKDERFLEMSEEAYAVFNQIYADDSDAPEGAEMRDLTLQGMLSDRKVCRNHGVTYNEICKLPAILYLYTKKEIYKRAAVNAFDKLYRDQMLIDGVNSSSEYLNGNSDSQAAHETCDISDLTWALGYLFMITGDGKYGDWIENAVFNAGLGAVDDDFRGEQYFSCPNQVLADDTSNHLFFFRGEDWMSYAPEKFLSCCAGNVHRFMPNYVARSWMCDREGLIAFLYAPSVCRTEVRGSFVEIEEKTSYPFRNSVKFYIKTEGTAEFSLRLRMPSWAVRTHISINGRDYSYRLEGSMIRIDRIFSDGDVIDLEFEDKIEFIQNAGGVSLKKGPLLYALPIREEKIILGLRDRNNEDFPHYALYPGSKWNYGMPSVREIDPIFRSTASVQEEPWRAGNSGLSIDVVVHGIPAWKLRKVNAFLTRKTPRGKGTIVHKKALFTPRVRNFSLSQTEKEEIVKLVPYATTRLRISIFPVIE